MERKVREIILLVFDNNSNVMIELEFYYLYEAGFVRISPQCGTNFKQTSRHFFKSLQLYDLATSMVVEFELMLRGV